MAQALSTSDLDLILVSPAFEDKRQEPGIVRIALDQGLPL